jgi:hypothetical protein
LKKKRRNKKAANKQTNKQTKKYWSFTRIVKTEEASLPQPWPEAGKKQKQKDLFGE